MIIQKNRRDTSTCPPVGGLGDQRGPGARVPPDAPVLLRHHNRGTGKSTGDNY